MDRMKKVLMMDSRTFNRLTTPKDKVLTSIDGEMSNILNDESIPEDVKAKLYSSAHSRFLKIEHPQWGETTAVTKTLNSPDFVARHSTTKVGRESQAFDEYTKKHQPRIHQR